MKKILVLLFTSLLIASMFVGCGSSSDGSADKATPPGSGVALGTGSSASKGDAVKTGLSSITGCKDSGGKLPGCS